ncbi:MAG: LuxR family transcriptional regulator, partial [bacterium]|nr:LuxR family transcriptional regulator [bacterium]
MLRKTLPELSRIVSRLRNAAAAYGQAERDLIKRTKDLRERNKELNCLYGISRIVERRGSIDGILQGIVTLIPASWQYP